MYFLSLKVNDCSHSHSAAVGTSTQKTTGDSAPPSRQTSSAEQPPISHSRATSTAHCPFLSCFVSSCPVLSRLVLLPALAALPPPREQRSLLYLSLLLLYFALLCSIFLYFSLFIHIAIVRISLHILLLACYYTTYCIYYHSVCTITTTCITATCYYYITTTATTAIITTIAITIIILLLAIMLLLLLLLYC